MLFNTFNGHYLLELQFKTTEKVIRFCSSISTLLFMQINDYLLKEDKENFLISAFSIQVKAIKSSKI